MHGIGYLLDAVVCVAQHDLSGCYHRLVDPFLCCDAAHQFHCCAEMALCHAQAVGIEVQLALFAAMLVDKSDESLKHVVCRIVRSSLRKVSLVVAEEDVAVDVGDGGYHTIYGGFTDIFRFVQFPYTCI